LLETTMFCSSCGTNVQPGNTCPSCGVLAAQAASAAPPSEVGVRIGGYLLDVIPAIIAGLAVGWIPIIGAVILGFLLLAYWLLRDITGASLGKLILGLVVVKKDGSPSGVKERLLRNVPLAIGPSMLIIPLAGYALAPPIAGILVLTEAILLLAKKERLGDMLAGTTVVKKAAVKVRAAGA
jgi:uncharacterized RDD family membrane protein YckC